MKSRHVKPGGFTLIELLLIIAIVGLLASVIMINIFGTRARANDTKTIAETNQYRKAFNFSLNDKNGSLPNPNTANAYFCLGKNPPEKCKFWGNTYSGNGTVTNALQSYLPANSITLNPLTVGGAAFDSIVYKCKSPLTGGVCNAAIYWAQSSNTACSGGILVYQGTNGNICGSNAADSGSDNVEATPSNFNYGIECDSVGVCTFPFQ